MNCPVDFRADLYSLGVTFYEVLAGMLPFQAADAMGMVHAHLAQIPVPLRQLNPRVPAALSAIVDKLLAKDPDDRYQSADGLRHDLERCLQDFQKCGANAPRSSPSAKKITPCSSACPYRMYGREPEVAALLGAFDRCADGARSARPRRRLLRHGQDVARPRGAQAHHRAARIFQQWKIRPVSASHALLRIRRGLQGPGRRPAHRARGAPRALRDATPRRAWAPRVA